MAGASESSGSSVMITELDDRRAEVTLTGDVCAPMLREMEGLFADPGLRDVKQWVVDLHAVPRIELACAYALLGAVTRHSGTSTVRGARRGVLRTLRHAGLDRAAVIEE
ncbi:STAS domain-containing protein [Streptomyces sp. NPDC054842]